MVTRNQLRAERERGPTPAQIDGNRRVLYDVATADAHAAIEAAEDAVAAVEAAATLGEAQDAVDGVAATLGSAKSGLEDVNQNLN